MKYEKKRKQKIVSNEDKEITIKKNKDNKDQTTHPPIFKGNQQS